jgi:thimet oligopeptidase
MNACCAAMLGAAVAFSASCSGSGQHRDDTSPSGEVEADDADADPDVAAFEKACREHFEKGSSMLDEIVAEREERTVENTLVPFNEMVMHIRNASGLASLMRNVHPSENVRNAAGACEQEIRAFSSDLSLNRELFEAFAAIDREGLDADTDRLVARSLRDFRRAGVDQDEATRERIREIDRELVELSQAFSRNISEDVRSIEVESVEELAGLPQDYIAAREPDDDGLIRITTEYPDYFPFMTYAESSELRRALYIENRTRAAENEEVLTQILQLRAEKAQLLGYDHWADYATEEMMIGSAQNAADFIERIISIAKPRAAADYEILLERKRQDVPDADAVADYEKSYYENLVKRERFDFDAQEARAYFPYERVEQGLLDATAEIFEIEYRRVEDIEVWHESVKVYDVFQNGDELGRIYLDMHPRSGKYGHAAQFTLRPGVGDYQRPEGVLVCNFPDPSRGTALMEHGEVTTMFHEFGHLMHTILGGQQRWAAQSGVATEWDFVEAPSQMFEEWAWNHDSLIRFAHHVETDEPISEELAERMRAADEFGKGLWSVQQMLYAAISLGFHEADPSDLDMRATLEKLQVEYTPFPYVEGTHFHTSFGHLDGYSAVYYTYMWSLVIAKDLFTPFAQHGIWNSEWARRYRDEVLVPGGTRDAADLVAAFLGREYSFDAFEAFLSR